MHRLLLWCAVVGAIGVPARADDTASSPETMIRLTVQPMAAPKPALRYLLLPELKEMNPGNPIQNYLKCFMEQHTFFFDKESVARREKLMTMPLKDLPAQEVQDYGGFALRQADWAARLDKADWQILLKIRTDGINLLLPDVQQLRTLANALKVRFRAQVASRRFDDALETAKTMFAISRHLSEHPTLIGALVGTAIAMITIGPLEEMLEQPGCPNLYWALTNLPAPLVSLDKAWEGERMFLSAELRDLDAKNPMSEAQFKKLIAYIDKLREMEQVPVSGDKSTRSLLDARIKDEASMAAARRRLVDVGFPQERLLQFPAEQVILLDEKREYDVRRDEIMKLMSLPVWHIETAILQTKTRVDGAVHDRSAPEPALFDFFLPALTKIHVARGRLEQRIALLRHVEALRLYAAEHGGRLPQSLAECAVPLPPDPFTGQPFRYRLDGNTAHLRGSPPKGHEQTAVHNLHYEVTIRQ